MTCVLSNVQCFPMIPPPVFFPPLPPFLVKYQNPDGSIDYYSFFSSLAEDSVNLQLFQELSCLQQIQQLGAFFPHSFHIDSVNKENNYFDENKEEKESLDLLPIDLSNHVKRKRKLGDEIRESKKFFRPSKKIHKKKESSPCLFIRPVLENLSILKSSPSCSSAPCSPPLPSRSPGAFNNHHWPKPGWDDEIISQIERRRARKYIETCLKQLKKHFNKRFKYRSRNTDDLRVQLMKHRCMNEIFEALEYFLEIDKIREQHLAESRKSQRCVSR